MHKLFLLPLLLFTALAGAAASGKIRATGRDGWQALCQIAESLEREAVIEEGQREASLHERARDAIAADLVAGRISLPEAAVRFREVNRQLAGGGHDVLNEYPGASEAERLCRQVLEWLRPTESNGPRPEARTAYRRLQAQLEELLRRDGIIPLPDLLERGN